MTYQCLVADKFSCKPEERFLEIVVRLGGDIVVLKVLLAMESDGLCFDLSLLHVDFIATEDNGNVFANADQVTYGPSVLSRQEPFIQ